MLATVFSGCATGATEFRELPAPTAAARPAYNLGVFDATWELVDRKYFDPQFRGVDWEAMRTRYRPAAEAAVDDAALYQVLMRLCAELRESHLAPLPPRRAHEIATSRRTAVGMAWVILEGRRVVTDLIPGGPADKAGVKPGWILTSRNGRPLVDLTPIPPRLGERVTYGFVDLENRERSLTFEPELLPLDQLVATDLPDGSRYLRFDRFSRESLRWLSRELNANAAAPGVVIDLRENPGGFLLACKVALGEFFDRRVVAGEFVSRGGRRHAEKGFPWFSAHYRGRVVILVGAATGSAAEIFAHVMQFEGRATVIGRRTAGAVIVSRNFPLPDGGQLQVPVEDYRGRDGRRLEGRGVIPDIGVPLAGLDDVRAGFDPDLATALACLNFFPRSPAPLPTAASGTVVATNAAGSP